MKTLDQAVIELNGVLPDSSHSRKTSSGYYIHEGRVSCNGIILGGVEQFQQRAIERGFVNGYRWGVEYKTEKVAPEVPDDLFIMAKDVGGHWRSGSERRNWRWDYRDVLAFKITDPRYKPADTSYLEKPALEPVPEEESWYDCDNEKMLSNPPAGAILEGYWPMDSHPKWSRCVVVYSSKEHLILKFDDGKENHYCHEDIISKGAKLRPLDHKAEAERKRALDVIYNKWNERGDIVEVAAWLYEKGFLKLPE